MIHARCYSDDHRVDVDFDATLYFEQASDSDLDKLAGCSYCYSYPADCVAQFMADHDPAVKRIFSYLEIVGDTGFECIINEGDVNAWLRARKED